MKNIATDIIIFGAGIAGLWLYNRLNQLGFHTILFDNAELGNGQTLSSQGIIHGGAKYTLGGVLSESSRAISAMPDRWRNCLSGDGEVDLSQAQILSPCQLMWSDRRLSSKLTAFFSSKVLSSKIKPLQKDQWPVFLQQPDFQGHVYQLNEPVLDIPGVVNCLYSSCKQRIFQLAPDLRPTFTVNNQRITSLVINNEIKINAHQFVFTAGEGNEQLLKMLKLSSPQMQRRPLHMVLAKSRNLPDFYAHAIGPSARPIVTITTHRHSDGEKVWYIGGNIAETGVRQNQDELIKQAQETIYSLLPCVDLTDSSWVTHRVNRAEPLQKDLLKPDTAFLQSLNNIHIGWPTKLALAPVLADKVIDQLEKENLSPSNCNDSDLAALAEHVKPAVPAKPLWERLYP